MSMKYQEVATRTAKSVVNQRLRQREKGTALKDTAEIGKLVDDVAFKLLSKQVKALQTKPSDTCLLRKLNYVKFKTKSANLFQKNKQRLHLCVVHTFKQDTDAGRSL